MEVYTEAQGFATADSPPEQRGVSVTKPIQAAKEAVPVIDLADRLCGPGKMRRIGENWTARCPLPDHDERTPSFTVYPGDRGWWCFGCGRGGDVVELARLAWGYPDDGRGAAEAAAYLLLEFSHEVPQRPPSWFRRQERQAAVRDVIEAAMIRHVHRRLYKLFFASGIERIPDDAERQEEKARVWEELRPVAVRVVDGRRGA